MIVAYKFEEASYQAHNLKQAKDLIYLASLLELASINSSKSTFPH